MKRALLISALMLAALSVSASVRGIVAQTADAARDMGQVTSDKTEHEHLLPAANIFESAKPRKAAVAVAPYKKVEALLPIVRDPSIREEHQKLASTILRSMIPAHCIGDLKNFYVSYEELQSRGYAGKDTIIISGNLPEKEMIGILVHETTHFLDLSGCTAGTSESGKSAFRDGKDVIYKDDPSVSFYALSWAAANIQKKGIAKADFVTGYAKSNCFEDMAESVAYYIVHQDDFRLRAKKSSVLTKKLQWIETHLFPGGRSLAIQDGPAFDGKIPWDATKLAFTWKTQDTVAAR